MSGWAVWAASPSACSISPGTGARSRPSTTWLVPPARGPRRETSRSSVLLPIPPGPCTSTTCAGGSSTKRESKKASSFSRPTKRWASRAARRSARVLDMGRARPGDGRRHVKEWKATLRLAGPMGGSSEIFRAGLLAGQTAMVTGGGTNLGREAARELLACGADVVIAGRREAVLAEAVAELGERCSYVVGDIRERDQADGIAAAALSRHGRVDVLVNNAGGQYFVPAEAIAAKGWRAVMRLNVGGTRTMTLAAAERAFLPAGAGTIVNVTVSPHHGMPAMAHTGAARAAVEALTSEWA